MKKLNETFKINPLYEADSYKIGHKEMMAKGATKEYWTWIPRNLKYMPKGIDKIMSAGQQIVWRYIHSNFKELFFNKSVSEALKFGQDMCKHIGKPFDANHFVQLHELGYLPVKIKALPEGMLTNPNIPHMTGINTIDGYAWLGLYLETLVSKLAWQCPTAATIAHKFKSNAVEWVVKTDVNNLWLADFMCHDFHSRGGNPFTSIAVGLGHAMSNSGSDTLNVIPASRYYYDFDENEVPIFSVTASEHSVSCTKIFTVGERQMIIDWLFENPTGILSIVGDTFDLWKLITEYLADPEIKALIMARDGKLVIRPDSGDPVDIICGNNIETVEADNYDAFLEIAEEILHEELVEETPHGECGGDATNKFYFNGKLYEVTYSPDWNRHDKQYYYIDNYGGQKTSAKELECNPSYKGVIELLWDIFDGTTNEQGFKVLDSHIGAIYGDSINLERQVNIYQRLSDKRFAATNIVLGVGSYTYVMLTRDSAGYAAKGAWFEVKEVADDNSDKTTAYNIYKDPITDDGTKKSLKGLLHVSHCDNTRDVICTQECDMFLEDKGLLRTIYENGIFHNQTTLTEIRERLKN